jgi:hypothetical protein
LIEKSPALLDGAFLFHPRSHLFGPSFLFLFLFWERIIVVTD